MGLGNRLDGAKLFLSPGKERAVARQIGFERAIEEAIPPHSRPGARVWISSPGRRLAERLYEQSLALFDQLGDEHGRAVLLHR